MSLRMRPEANKTLHDKSYHRHALREVGLRPKFGIAWPMRERRERKPTDLYALVTVLRRQLASRHFCILVPICDTTPRVVAMTGLPALLKPFADFSFFSNLLIIHRCNAQNTYCAFRTTSQADIRPEKTPVAPSRAHQTSHDPIEKTLAPFWPGVRGRRRPWGS